MWNILTGNCINRCNFKHKDPIVAVKINREYVLSSCKGGLVKLWHIATGNLIKVTLTAMDKIPPVLVHILPHSGLAVEMDQSAA